MIYQEYSTDTHLNDFVKCFWTLNRTYTDSQNFENVLPDSYFELIINLGDPYFIYIGNEVQKVPKYFLLGMLSKPFKLYSTGQANLIAARLYPWGAKGIFGNLINSITDNFGDVSYLFDQKSPITIQTVEEKLLSIIITSNFTKDKVSAATQILYQTKGIFKINDLAKILFTNSRTLQLNFQQDYGITAKSLAKNFRFDKIKKQLSKQPDTNLVELAYEYGYTDQAHFSKDFKSFTGMTPTEFCNSIKAL